MLCFGFVPNERTECCGLREQIGTGETKKVEVVKVSCLIFAELLLSAKWVQATRSQRELKERSSYKHVYCPSFPRWLGTSASVPCSLFMGNAMI